MWNSDCCWFLVTFCSALSETNPKFQLDERKKEKQRKLLLDASDMLMGTTVIEDFDEEPHVNQPKTDEQVVPNKMENIEKKKPLSWPEPGNRHEYDYDDDIVEYKESDSLDEANQKPLAYTSEINHFISKKKNEPTTIFESYDHHLTPFSSTIRVPPTVEEILESPASLSPISEANENLDKLSESAAVTETTSSTLSTPEKVSPSTIDMSPPRFIPTNDTNKVVSQVIPEDEELPTTAVAEKRDSVGVSSQRRKPDERVTEKEHADDERDTPQGHVDAVVLERFVPLHCHDLDPQHAIQVKDMLAIA
ncbi:unnamed protein product [Anisakis simplex]|uniref:Seminal fluid protein n=1 Tax=Anisakis simplex TaxID=6269 RepID=A0A0M3J314_ANISI|nr:unnamed protein product [Anisakis simplex]